MSVEEKAGFIASGPNQIGFFTNSGGIQIGAYLQATDRSLQAVAKGNALAIVATGENREAISGTSTGSYGVIGQSSSPNAVGVFGTSSVSGGNGIKGEAGPGGRGGIFSLSPIARGKVRGAQVQLVPDSAAGSEIRTGQPTAGPVEQFNPKGVSGLPEDGQIGDLLLVSNESDQQTLWLCVGQNGTNTHAVWCEVLLGRQVK